MDACWYFYTWLEPRMLAPYCRPHPSSSLDTKDTFWVLPCSGWPGSSPTEVPHKTSGALQAHSGEGMPEPGGAFAFGGLGLSAFFCPGNRDQWSPWEDSASRERQASILSCKTLAPPSPESPGMGRPHPLTPPWNPSPSHAQFGSAPYPSLLMRKGASERDTWSGHSVSPMSTGPGLAL